MSRWHYQLMYHRYNEPHPVDGEGYYAIHEFYRMDDEDGWTHDPVEVTGDSVEDVKKSLLLMLQDIEKHGVKEYGTRNGRELGAFGSTPEGSGVGD